MATARRLPPAERRAQLIDAALALFATRPEEEVGLEDLAAAAGVTRNLLYRYFASRAELHRAAVDEAIARLAARFDRDPERPLHEKLPANVGRWMDGVERGDPAVLLMLRAGRSADPEVLGRAVASREALARAIAFNHLGEEDPPVAVVAALDGYLTLAERLIDRWTGDGTLTRSQVESVLASVLPPLVAAARGPD